MTSSTTSVLYTNRIGDALSTSEQPSSSRPTTQKQSSLPMPEEFPEVDPRSKIDDFLFDNQKQLGNRNTMMANYINTSKQRAQYYEEQFQYKDNATSNARERAQRESPVIAELRTNVIIKDEYTLVTDLSYHLATRYTRPDSAIMVKVDHSACLAFGGTFEPCYILEITAVSTQTGPTTNKRNAALIQSFMADILSVPPERGIIKFSAIPEENLATNGTTMVEEADRQEKAQVNDSGNAVRRAISSGRKSMSSFKKSSEKLNANNKMADLKPTESNTSDAPSPLDSQERTGSTQSAMAQSLEGVFELSAVSLERPRPSTSHSHSGSGESNPLRMNGISDLELSIRNSKKANDRPRTVSGDAASIQDQIRKQAATESLPDASSKRQSTVPIRPKSFLKTDMAASTTSLPTTTNSKTVSPLSPTIPEKPVVEGKKTDANTAKRRSTINASAATTALPTAKSGGLEPPPIPLDETRSMRSLRLGKRKSFLAAFRRSTAAVAQ